MGNLGIIKSQLDLLFSVNPNIGKFGSCLWDFIDKYKIKIDRNIIEVQQLLKYNLP